MTGELPCPALLVTEPVHCRYFHHQQFAAGAVYVTEHRTVYLSWNGRGVSGLPEGVECRDIRRIDLGKTAADLLRSDGISQIAVEPTVPLDIWSNLCNASLEVLPLSISPVEALREIKTDWEMLQLQAACDITDKAFDAVLGFICPGITELELAAELEKAMRLMGAEELNHTIVAAGSNSAYPHHWPADYVLQYGDFVTMDYGCTVNGYHSDMTRTVVIGRASDRQKEIYQTVLEAQLSGLEALRAGIPGGAVDRIARDIIETRFPDTFLHGLGHGIGLDIHEGTGLAREEPRILQPGMVVSVEPGIYIADWGGVRIEDIALVQENGCRPLEHSTKEFLVV